MTSTEIQLSFSVISTEIPLLSDFFLLIVGGEHKKQNKQNFTLLLTNYLSMGVLGVVSIVSDLWRNFLNFSLFELSELFSILSESHNVCIL